MLPTRDSPQNKRPTQTESEGLEKIFQTNGQEKISQSISTYIQQNIFPNKGHKKKNRRTLHYTQGTDPSR